MPRLKVAHVVATFPPYWGGTGNVAFHNAQELARRGHSVTVFTAQAPSREVWRGPDDFKVRRLPAVLRFGNAPLTPALATALRGYDLVHLHWPFIFGAEFTWLGCRLSDTPYVVTYHHDLRRDLRWQFGPYQALIGPLVLRSAAHVMAVSLDHFRESPMYRWAPKPIGEIPNGVDVQRFHPEVSGQSVRRRLGIADGVMIIGYLGAMDRAHAFKGVPNLIKAFGSLSRDDVALLAVGGGDLRDDYQRQAAADGLASRAYWPGIVADEDLPAYVAAMDLLAFPTLGAGAESFGIVLIEAMATARPVVASALPGVRTVVTDGVDGFLVPPGDVPALARGLARLIDDPATSREMGRKGRAKVERAYDWRLLAERIDDQYQRVLARGSSRLR